MVFCGFAINYMLRINLNIAIVAMVVPRPHPAIAVQCAVEDDISRWKNVSSISNVTNTSLPISTTILPINTTNETRFHWNEYQQGLALSGYYWLHWLTQLPGGILARRYGTKFVFGMANIMTAMLGFLSPAAAKYDINALLFIRIIQGFVAGFSWPAMHALTAKWIPLNERSKFVSAYLGSSIGAAITYPMCAIVIDWYGWEAVFYVTSLIATIWYVFWIFLVYDSPQQHPRIGEDEKSYILENLAGSVADRERNIPWKAILSSKPLWILITAQWGGAWGFLTLMTQAPSYFNYIHGWNIHATGILSGLPHITRMAFAYFFSVFCDWLLRTKRMTVSNVRKLATFMCSGGQGILTLGLGLSGCHPIMAVIFMIAGTTINGAISAGPLASFVDLSPNYASVLLGLSGLVTLCGGFLSPMIVGILTNNNQTIEQWRYVFIIAAANLWVSCIVYMLFGTSEEQPWNRHGQTDKEKGEELQKLKSKSETGDQIN
ncbi:putative inorganic phosphate cotransporter isoform X2 [Cephus cinctus]|nr:putative inorganic phosphate cotransporter isoform X2 [Cephus cinctus]XP_024938192.1 putative inorganic phosphate cotransporter isoform X2 [Cephus cinctus]